MKVLFLDVDGVLVTRRPRAFEPELLDNLRAIVDRTGARLVLSSDWRRAPDTRAAVSRALATRGLRLEACTPEHGPPQSPHRPTEILAWIDDHNARCAAEGRAPTERVDAFVAVDDRPLARELAGEALVGRFVMTAPSAGLTAPARDAVVACLLAPQNVPDVLLDRRRRRAVGAGESTVTLTASTTVSLAASPELKAFTLLRPFDDARRAASLDVRGRGGGKSRAAKKRKDETRRAVVTLRGSASSDSGNDAGSGEEGTGEDIDITADDVSQAWFPRTPTREAKAPLETTRTTPTTTRASSSRRHARRSPTPMSTRRAHDATNASVSSSSSVVSHPRARTSSGDVASSFSRRTVRDGGTGAKSLASRRSGSRGGSEVQPSSAPELPPIRVSSASAGGIGSVLAQGAKFLVGAPSQSAHVIRYREGK